MARRVPEQERCSIPGMEFIYVTESKIKYINTNYKKSGAQMYDHNCDVKLKVANTSFKAHKNVLSEASDYFAAMFSHDMVEKEQGVIVLHEMSPAGFGVVLDYFYHGHVTMDKNIVADVLEAARFFHVDWLIEVCCEYLVRHLCLADYEEVLHLAELFALGDLKPNIYKFLSENLLKLTEDPTSNFFNKLSMELLSEFLREDIYQVVSEGFLISIILQWVETDPEQRRQQLVPLLRLVRFPLVELEDLETLPEAVASTPEIQDAVEEAKRYHFDIPAQCLKNETRFISRGAKPVIAVMTFHQEQNVIMYKFPDKDDFVMEELAMSAVLDNDFDSAGLATVGNFLYAVGGYSPSAVSSNKVFRFDSRTREWMELASMNQQRVSFAITSSDDRIFVFGGIDHQQSEEEDIGTDNILRSFEMYDAGDNTWITLADILTPSFSQAAAAAGENVYLCGGISGDEHDPVPLGSASKFSLASESWEPINDMLVPRHSHSMTHHNGKLYVVGGYTSSVEDAVFIDCIENEVYDVETCQWTKIMAFPDYVGHVFNDAVVLNNMLYVVAGVEQNCFLHSYDVEADKIDEGILIGPCIRRMCALKVAFPPS